MLGGLRWLALEVKYLDRARAFYEAFLDLEVVDESANEVRFSAGESHLVLRAPSSIPRGGLHTHYALSIPEDEYDDWYDRLGESFDLVEHTFGDARSLYFYDPDGNCVELGERPCDGPGIDGIFEVVLEVEALGFAQDFYERLGFELVDEDDERTRVRLSTDTVALELWEPHLGLADARGGVHVDIGVEATDPKAVTDAVRADARGVSELANGYRIRDPDGHYLSVVSS